MAEFQEVMRQAKRMCQSFGMDCMPCELHKMAGACPLIANNDDHVPMDWDLKDMQKIERIVMDWAAKHPEPRYPSWAEWQKANFPNALHSICPDYFMREKPLGTCAVSCAKCTGTPIPADIAEKLGIKPIGGVSDEHA